MFSSPIDWQPANAAQSDSTFQFEIRTAQPGDLTSLAGILADSFHVQEGIWGWAYPLLRLGIYEDLRNRLRSPSSQHVCLVAAHAIGAATGDVGRAGNDLAGSVEMALRSTDAWSRDGCRYPYLSNLAVHPSRRRRGVAKQLLLKCEQIALSWGYQGIYLHVLENNHQARQLYFKLGYRLHQVDSNWSTWLLGRPRQLFLHKQLTAR